VDSVEGQLRLVDIQRFLRRVGASRGILFGSRARGDYVTSSDVDLIVISDSFAGMRFPWRMVFLHENWDLPFYLEGLPYTEEEFGRLNQTSGVVQDAMKHGVEIWPEA
jgi:predicted nucleotidyltransferase